MLNDPHWSAPNARANTDNTPYAQQEPSIAVNPLNHLNVVAAQKDERSAPSAGTATKEVWIDTSTDGGVSWINTRIPMPDNTLPQQSDAVVTFSDNNNVFVTIIGYNQNNPTNSNTVLVARSTDGGLTWPTPAVKVDPGLGGSDKEWTAVDLNPASAYYHRLYVTWTNFAAGPQFVEKWSSDNGVTWNPQPGSSYVTVSFGGFDGGQFSMPVVLPNGNVIATWEPGGRIAVGKSTDGGQSFINPNTQAVAVTEVNSVPGSNWRLNTIPSTAASQASSTLVTVWADGRNGKDDIYFSRSTNGGTTWSAAARVAHNAAGSSYQVEPWVAVAPNGRFDVIWYDDRDFPANLNTFHIYASHSTDDGATWNGPDEQVTDAATNLNIDIPTGPGWNAAAGDYIGVTSANDVVYGAWTDTRSGTNEDIYTAKYTPPSQGTPTATATGTPPTATRTSTPAGTATTVPPTPTVPASSTPAASPTVTLSSTPAASPTCGGPGAYRILIAYADTPGPTTLRTNLLAQPGVSVVDLFDAQNGTPSVAQMQQYDLVLTYSNFHYADPTTLGDNLADYQDGGGIV
ncbi:MAG: glycoside hydrolase, partial [Candidatus Dormibacteraeota bacterium]|nr:glycoside hydrolase [Candidatus Dormibacteraeota bacterium]